MLRPTPAQKLDTELYNHTVSPLHFSAFFGHHQGGIW